MLGYSGLIDHLQSTVRPDWQRVTVHRDAYPNRALCPNSGYVEELLLPQLEGADADWLKTATRQI